MAAAVPSPRAGAGFPGTFQSLETPVNFSLEYKLRQYTRHPTMGGTTSIPQALLDEAADEIERLRNEVAQLRHAVAMAKLPTDVPLASRAFPNPFKL